MVSFSLRCCLNPFDKHETRKHMHPGFRGLISVTAHFYVSKLAKRCSSLLCFEASKAMQKQKQKQKQKRADAFRLAVREPPRRFKNLCSCIASLASSQMRCAKLLLHISFPAGSHRYTLFPLELPPFTTIS